MEGKRTMHELSEDFNKKKKYLQYQKETMELKNIVTELKKSLDEYNRLNKQKKGSVNLQKS